MRACWNCVCSYIECVVELEKSDWWLAVGVKRGEKQTGRRDSLQNTLDSTTFMHHLGQAWIEVVRLTIRAHIIINEAN